MFRVAAMEMARSLPPQLQPFSEIVALPESLLKTEGIPVSAAPDRREKENEAKDRPESTWLHQR
jgi:hypothetical protein